MKVSLSQNSTNYIYSNNLFIDPTIPTPSIYHYETISSSPVRSSYENNTQQQPVYVSFQPNSPYQITTIPTFNRTAKSIIPPFQRKFPIVPVAILGLFELLAGLIVLALELLIFDIALGLWCGSIYALAGASIIVLGWYLKFAFLKHHFFYV
jgi:hypothetical protein